LDFEHARALEKVRTFTLFHGSKPLHLACKIQNSNHFAT
jgi:hypothetical protein